MNFVG